MSRSRTLSAEEAANNICSGDCCVGAVQRSYREMCESGAAETVAFEAALRVFHWHHPEVAAANATTLVRGWVTDPDRVFMH